MADKFSSPPDEGDQVPADDESPDLADQVPADEEPTPEAPVEPDFDELTSGAEADESSAASDEPLEETPVAPVEDEAPSAPEQPATPAVAAKSARPKKKAKAEQEAEEPAPSEPEPEAEAESADQADHPARPVHRELTQAPVKKNRPTNKQSASAKAEPKRTTPALFARQSVGELRKVVWPSGDTTGQYFVIVLVFVVIIMGIVFGLDQFFGWIMIKWLG